MIATAGLDLVAEVQAWVDRYSAGDVPLAALLCDRHAGDRARLALSHEDAAGHRTTMTYDELRERSGRLAGALHATGVGAGDRVVTLLPRRPELLVAAIALWRLGAVHVPLFTAFGPDAVEYRVAASGARAAITDAANRDKLPGGIAVLVAGGAEAESLEAAMSAAARVEGCARYGAEDVFALMYTSGTTGHPKGVRWTTRVLASIEQYLRYGIGLRDEDVFWSMADPAWAYGLGLSVLGPLLVGHTTLFYEGPFDPAAVYRILAGHGVTNVATAPTAYRSLRAAGVPDEVSGLLRLERASSCGEPLEADVVRWAQERLGVEIRDHYGQTETSITVANHHHPALRTPLRPGSMGHPTTGYRVVVIDDADRELPAGRDGRIAVDAAASPLFCFAGYHDDPAATAARFTADGRYFLTGDAGRRDEEGYFWFAARADDVIISAGYRIGPFEVENALAGHPAVAEAAVIGAPDPRRGQVVKAFVVPRAGVVADDALARDIAVFVKRRLSAHAYPRDIAFVERLPRTPSGKVQRFLLRAG